MPLRHPGDIENDAVRASIIILKTPLMTTPPYVSLPGISLRQIGLRGRGHPQDNATLISFADSKRPILGLSNEVSFVPEILWKDG